MAETNEAGEAAVTYEDLANLEHEFEEVDAEVCKSDLRFQYHQSKHLYARRKSIISKLPGFWPLVLEQAPPEIDRYIQPSDSEIFAKCLTGIDVDHFELSPDTKGTTKDGEPRSVSIGFSFSENEWFEDRTLEKRFWWRMAKDGWTGFVSEPIRIHWRKGKDPTKGLMEGALRLWNARRQAGDMSKRELPEFDAMAKITETWNGENTSFFTWFAYVSSRRWVSEDESRAASAAAKERRERVRDGGENDTVARDQEEEGQLERQVEAHEDGDGLATVISEDLWPRAIKYFTQAQEDDVSSIGGFEEEEDDDEDESEGVAGDDAQVDLRSLVRGGVNGESVDRDRKRRKVREHDS